jgi:hypothetical protein
MIATLHSAWSARVPPVAADGPWSPLPPPARPIPAAQPPNLTCTIDDGADGIALTATCAGLRVHKTVKADGRAEAILRRARDETRVAIGRTGFLLGRRAGVIELDPRATGGVQSRRIRSMLYTPAVRTLRAIAAALEDGAVQSPEWLGLRLTAAVLAFLDGDEGAIQRLARELATRPAPPQPAAAYAEGWPAFNDLVSKASADLFAGSVAGSYSSPMHAICGVGWALQVEAAWFRYVRRWQPR